MAGTNLAQAVEATNDESTYDENVKCLLADKQVLARILKYSVQEFQDMSIEEIMSCIGTDIEVGTRPVDAGLSNLGRAEMSNTEDSVPGEGKIFFDIRFSAYPKKEEMKILINIEAQKSSSYGKLGYHLENRIIFYLSRMVSAQKQTEFYHSDYDNLKKVRSIWICMDTEENGDCIEEISLERKTVFGNKINPYSVDLMKGIIIHIRGGEKKRESGNVLISLLERLLSHMDADEKKRILTQKYGMIMTTELDGRIKTMCNLSEYMIERGIEEGIEKGIKKGIKKGIEQGIEKGIEQGIEKGIEKERANAIERMMKAGATKEQIVSYGYTQEEYAQAERLLYVNA